MTPHELKSRLRIPVIGSPMFIISNPDLVIAQCKAGIVGSFPALNARPEAQLDEWLAESHDGVACAIVAPGAPLPDLPATDRIRALSPAEAKGLEFDLVVLVDPDSFGAGVTGAVDRYVAMTRSTQRLVVLR